MTFFRKLTIELHMQVHKIVACLHDGKDPGQLRNFEFEVKPSRLPPWEELEVCEDGLRLKHMTGKPNHFERTKEFFAYALSNDAPVRVDPRLAHFLNGFHLPAPMLPVALEEVRTMGLDIDGGRVLEHDIYMIYEAARNFTETHNRVHPAVLEYMRDSFQTLIYQRLWHRSPHTTEDLLHRIVVTVRDTHAPQPRPAAPLSGSAPA